MRPWPEWLKPEIKGFEGLHDGDPRTSILEPKRDPIGLWTAGWGHLLTKDVTAPRPPAITLEEAEEFLEQDINKAARSVLRLVKRPLTDGEYAALIDFVFNLGPGSLQMSTLLRRVNEGDTYMDYDIPYQFMRWVYAGGKKLPGLVKRRAAEARWWQGVHP